MIEIRGGEGGADAKLLVLDQLAIYHRFAVREGIELELIERQPGMVAVRATGKKAKDVFRREPGGHRWQRIPPTEKRGRVHTSTVTVAVLPEPTNAEVTLADSDVEVTTTRGSGPGGQHRNKTESCVTVKHKPTGLTVRCDEDRHQQKNRELAMGLLRARVWEARQQELNGDRAGQRKQQVGSGMRADKVRTYRSQDGVVTDHRTNKKAQLKRVTDGYLKDLW